MTVKRRPAVAPAWAAACVALAGGLVASEARAAVVRGAAAIITDRSCTGPGTCTVPGPDGPTLPGPKLQPNQLFGGYGKQINATTVNLAGDAKAGVIATLGSAGELGAGSWAGAGTRTGATATMFDVLTWTGSYDVRVTWSGYMHFITSGDAAGPSPYDDYAGDGTFNLNLSFQSVANLAAAYKPGMTAGQILDQVGAGFADCGSGAIGAFAYSSGGLAAGEYYLPYNASTTCSGKSIILHPGQSIGWVASLQAISNRGGFMDGMHTFHIEVDPTLTVNDETGESVGAEALAQFMTFGKASVPEPAAWALMIAGFGLAGSALRRRMAAA